MRLGDLLVQAIDSATSLNARLLMQARWYPSIVGYGGYGNLRRARVLGRALMGTRFDERNWLGEKRGWRQYLDAQVPRQPVRVVLGQAERAVTTDRGGYLNVILEGHGLPAGWHTAEVHALKPVRTKEVGTHSRKFRLGRPTRIPVRIVGDDERVGIISDVDDTIMVTAVPQPLVALRHMLLEWAAKRQAVPGMARFLRNLQTVGLREAPGAPPAAAPALFYLSNGAWNAAPTLRRFLARLGYPQGTLLLRPWGISAHGLPQRGMLHKLRRFAEVVEMLPQLQWFLVGDDGEHDPRIYAQIAADYPDKVLAIFIRTLREREHLTLHGTLHPLDSAAETNAIGVPTLRGRNGFVLTDALHDESFLNRIKMNITKRPKTARRPSPESR